MALFDSILYLGDIDGKSVPRAVRYPYTTDPS